MAIQPDLSPDVIVDEDRYRAALTAERSLAELDRARASLVAELHSLSSCFSRNHDGWTTREKPESELELVVYTIASDADFLATFVAYDGDGSSYDSEGVRKDMATIVELVEYLRDVERYQALGQRGRAPFLSEKAKAALDSAREALTEEDLSLRGASDDA